MYVLRHFLKQVNIDDVDDMLKNEFGFKYEFDDDFELENDFIIINKETLRRPIGHDSSIININTLINSLETLRNEGSTHVAVDWHCDHLSYELYGYDVTYAGISHIEDYNNTIKDNEKRRKQISELQDRLKQLNNEL